MHQLHRRRVESPVTSGTFTALNGDPANCSNFKYGENKDFVRIRIDVGKLDRNNIKILALFLWAAPGNECLSSSKYSSYLSLFSDLSLVVVF